MGGHQLDSVQDRLHQRDPAALGDVKPSGIKGLRAGLTTSEREELKRLKRENRQLRQANEILRKASAFFAQAELDRKPR